MPLEKLDLRQYKGNGPVAAQGHAAARAARSQGWLSTIRPWRSSWICPSSPCA
jgi:ribosomal protein L19E